MTHPFSRRALVAALAVAGTFAGLSAWAGQSAESLAFGVPAGAPATDRLIVKYRDGVVGSAALDRAQELANRSGVQLRVLRDTALGAKVLKMDQRLALKDARRLARALAAADADIEYAEPDQILQAQLTPNDTSYASQWHYYEATGGLNLPPAWDKSTGTGVVVAVVDTGYRPHADLAANLVAGYDMIADVATANDGNGRDADASDPGDWIAANECGYTHSAQNSSWHGTHVAGTIAAVTNNASGVAGVAFGAKVQPVRVLGKCGGYTSDIADGIIWASGGTVSGVPANATPSRVINMSLGGSGACATTTQNAINGARSRGTVVVVAAGNSNANASNFNPANCAGVITVASVGRTGARAYYSNFGAVVDLAAPGGDMSSGTTNGVYSTLNAGTSTPGADSYAYYQGTSMATPHVAGAAALMLAANPALTPDQVETRMKASTRAFPGVCSQCGTGIVDANAAVDAAIVVNPPPTWTDVNEVESNNTRNSAQTITPDPARVLGTISGTGDNDYYKFSVAAGATLVGSLTPNASSDYDLYLYNASGTQLASSTLGTGAVDTITRTNTGGATTWYLRVRYYSGGTGATNGKYTLTIDR